VPPEEPTPQGYYRDLLAEPSLAQQVQIEKRIRFFGDLFELAKRDPHGASVLEAGSGFGLGLILLAAFGAATVRGVEIVPWMVEYARQCIAELPPGLRSRVEAVPGSVDQLPYPDASFDIVLSIEAISHYLDYRPFLGEARRVLRPGGVLIVSDKNNGLNPFIRWQTWKDWASHEVDPERSKGYGSGSPWLFVNKRQEIIQTSFPETSSSEAHQLAMRTSGMVRDEVIEAVRAYLETNVLPTSVYRRGQLSVHPDHEMVMERLFNPYQLAREIRNHGFRVKVRGHWAGASGKPAHRAVDRVLRAFSPLTIVTARGFRIVAYSS
jgi:ubiquinone/menaquinone biosynthesis C-methylase UbiE